MTYWKAKAYKDGISQELDDGREQLAKDVNKLGGYNGFKTKKGCQATIDAVSAAFHVKHKAAFPMKVEV